MPEFPQDVLDNYREKQPFNEADMFKLLKIIYERFEEKLMVYGNVVEMFHRIELLAQTPEVVRFNDNKVTELSEDCIATSFYFKLADNKNSGYYSKLDIARQFFNGTIRVFRNQNMPDISMLFFVGWFMSLFNRIRKDLMGTCEYVPEAAWLAIKSEINDLKCKPSYRFRYAQVDWFYDLVLRMEERYDSLLENPLDCLIATVKKNPITKFQSFYSYAFTCVEQMIEETKKIYNRHIEVFQPLPEPDKIQICSKWHIPVIRLFITQSQEFYFAREVKNAVEIVMKLRSPQLPFPEDLIRLESEEEKKNGIVYSLSNDEFVKILEKVKLTKNDLQICIFPMLRDYDYSFIPILSACGAHCKPAFNVFDIIIYYIVVVLKCFESDAEHIQKTISWIGNLDYLFTVTNNLYFIELWKVEDLIKQARVDLTPKKKKNYRVSKRKFNQKTDVLFEVQMLTKNLQLESNHLKNAFLILKKLNLEGVSSKKDVYFGYSQVIKIYIMLKNGKLGLFFEHQAARMKNIYFDKISSEAFTEELTKFMKKPEKKEIIEIKSKSKKEIKTKRSQN